MENFDQQSSAQSMAEHSPAPSKSSFHSKTIIISIILFILVVISSLMLILGSRSKTTYQQPYLPLFPVISPTASDADRANWKTYTNTKVGFEINYPGRFGIPVVPSSNGAMPANGLEDDIDIEFFKSPSDYVSLSVIPFTKDLDELKTYGGDVNAETIFLKNGPIIQGSETRWYIIKGPNNYKRYKIDFLGKGHAFTVEYDGGHLESEIDQILSNFRFLGREKTSVESKITFQQAIEIAKRNGFNADDLHAMDGFIGGKKSPRTGQIGFPTIRVYSCTLNKTMHLDPVTGTIIEINNGTQQQYENTIWCGGTP